jgi:glycosyltransferase involved in cell wall biosynthesis
MGEVLLSTMMLRGLRKSPLADIRWDAVVWYSPTIFLGQLVGALKKASGARAYLILRDVFPEWAVDMGLLKMGPIYYFFKYFERLQYSVADVIGVQSHSNMEYLSAWVKKPGRRLEVLQNWLAPATNVGCSIAVEKTSLAGRNIIAYAGNMGVAQGMDMVIGLAQRMRERRDLGFLFVGRGSDVLRLKAAVAELKLDNVAFHDEIEPREVPGLLAQAHVGLVMLDPRHKTHNVPGKFITYMQAGVPVLARINDGNDLASLIAEERVGQVYVGESVEAFYEAAIAVCDAPDKAAMSNRARQLADRFYSSRAAVQQIVASLN